ncbi:LANO_0G11408g1_1 [Lachancea nothofagi CBS 11611]|uniref:U3 small nucleolar RNA-associated protein 22 n=1 Tax=Lachancea nothofagi CBS 11611 TaxID=1266666 RepID=A0A1G4KJK2_9SACH|nr:LANO_0G11408g1_1 [Lachancea nothofagi CBS 11611]
MAQLKRRASDTIDTESPWSGTGKSIHKKTLIEALENGAQVNGSEVHEESGNADEDESGSEEEQDGARKQRRVGQISAQDVQVARATAELFKSNIFKLQIDELLQQIKLKDSHILRVEKFLHKLYDTIQKVPEWEPTTLADVESYFKGKIVSVPFTDPKPAPSVQYKFDYKTPDVSLIGSFALKCATYDPKGSSVDVLLTMPMELFDKKDFLNFRCIHKRSVYLAYFVHHLSVLFAKDQLSEFLQFNYDYLNDDPLCPILRLQCKPGGSSEYNFYKTNFSINIIIGFPYGFFDAKKLLPNKNCIRVQEDKDTMTPLYNFSVLSSSTHDHYLKFLYKTKKQTEAFKDACMLGKLWLKQRGFSSKSAHSGGLGGFGSFEFATLMSALLCGGGVNGNKILLHGFSSYQLFKGVMKYLATMDLCSQGHLQFYSDLSPSSNLPTSRYLAEGFQTPTIFDKTTKVNILTKMSVRSYQALQIHARETFGLLSDVVRDQFSNIFLTNLNRCQEIKYDMTFDLDLPTQSVILDKFGPTEKIKFVSLENFVVNKISNVAKIALGERIKSFEVELVNYKTWFPISKRKPNSSSNIANIKIHVLVNPNESEKLVTKGPLNTEENTSEAMAFRNFWGKKSSLRRFKDGSITNCCVWNTSASEPVIFDILSYIFKLHLAENAKLSNSTSKQFQELLPLPNLPASSSLSVLSLGSFYNVRKSFDALSGFLFKLSLPLSIKSVLPVGPAFRYTTTCQPVPFAYSNPDFLQDVILEFESSPKWPDEITSLEKAKTAFLLKVEEELLSSNSEYKTFFARDESIPYNLEIVTLNVLTPEGYGFKIRVLTERDEVLYLRAISNARNEVKPELEKVFLKFTAKYLASARHNRTLETLAHSHPLYPPVVRLFKKWLDCHLLLTHLPEELVELIAMKPFVECAPYFVPGSVENGFLKIIKFLSQWNWREDPLILDLVKPEELELGSAVGSANGIDLDAKVSDSLRDNLTLSQIKAIQSNFTTLRKSDPQGLGIQFFVASKSDPSGILYSSGIPLPIATRLTALSKVAYNLIQTHGLNKQTVDLLFTPALKDYDFVVKLRMPTPLKLSSGVLETNGFKNLDQQQSSFPKDLSQMSDKMDPSFQLVKYLNMKYKNSIIFSSHRYPGINGGEKGDQNVITGLIRPNFKSPVKFRVNMDANVKPVSTEQVILNKEAIFNEIAVFGDELITEFEFN